ncbi:hypothetical protein NUU61_002160 [Penicillium alfredii]|uniref:SH3 domain-containing protein n=1 Tax=Penicillium alfredii TaxID=1506179 RepID=A0A9W9FR37_9EURO|nr:uncharacterized protein NUU61_002160 [Penicillium alfredii]KAJ5104813.1 hypothetical protein NUU61_002160 [Penicillium alfredii]
MLSMQRHFARVTSKRSADDSQIAVLLKDFEDGDMLMTKIVDSSQSWRDAWVSIATFQSRLVDEFDGLYGPIVGTSETPSNHKAIETPPATLARTNKLRKEYDELRTDLLQELDAVEQRMTRPAAQAKESLTPMKKTIKKRNDKKLDFERHQGRVDGLVKKPKRSDRDNTNLAKAETELANAKVVYQAADDDLRQRLPTLISLIFSLAPCVLEAQIEIQNRMLAHYYTVLHTYCEEEQFPSPPPPMEQVIQDWEYDSQLVQQKIERFGCITQGKAIRQSMAADAQNKRPPMSSRANSMASQVSNMSQRKPTVPPPIPGNKPCGLEAISPATTPSIATPCDSISISSSAATTPLPTGGDSYMPPPPVAPIPPAPVQKPTPPAGVQFSPAGPNIDHFRLARQTTTTSSSASSLSSSAALSDAIKLKKARPPPPPPAARSATFVTALYDFDGHRNGDLAFREGDRIRVVEKTDSTEDWWEGELKGVKGAFPANYVEE